MNAQLNVARKPRRQRIEPSTEWIVRAADGFMIAPGQVAFRGVLFQGDLPVANFSNDGNGGCNRWVVRAAAQFEEFKAHAKRQHPELGFEQEDHAVGALWDAAMLRRKV